MATNSYDSHGTLRTSLPREGVDIGPQPDFWGDMGKIVRTLRPVASPQAQVQALRTPDVQAQAPMRYSGGGGGYDRDAAPMAQPQYDYEPIYGTLTYPHGSAGFYQNYQPGQALGTGQQPVAMGTQRVRRS